MTIARRGPQLVAAASGVAVSSLSVAMPADVTPGNALVVGVVHKRLTNPTIAAVGSVTDDQGNTYQRDAYGLAVEPNGQYVALFSTQDIGGGPFTITYDPLLDENIVLIVQEYSGLAAAALDVAGAGGSAVSATTYDSGVTEFTNESDGLAVAVGTFHGAFPDILSTPNSPFAEISANPSTAAVSWNMADRVVTEADVQQCFWLATDPVTWDSCIAVYRAAPPVSASYDIGSGNVAGRYPWDL